MNAVPLQIYLVDAHVFCREGLRRLLEQQPHITVVGESGEVSTCRAQIQAAAPHMVLLDLEWHSAAGLALCQQLTTTFPRIKVIVFSTVSDLAAVTQALEAGATGYVLKDVAIGELFHAIATVQDGHAYLSAKIATLLVGDYLKTAAAKNALAPAVSLARLTEREQLLLKLVAEGRRSKEIAEAMGVRVKSAETYRSRLMKKLGCASTTALVHFAIREGIVAA